jgi:hypothetical protein
MIARIVSGGQSGVDRAALDFAIARGIAHGGWCPRGRRSETGRIPDLYQLTETESSAYPVRTEMNVLDSDGTLIIARGPPQGGTRRTLDLCVEHAKPAFVADLQAPLGPQAFAQWVRDNRIGVLNVAGPRESEAPGIGKEAQEALQALFAALGPRERP